MESNHPRYFTGAELSKLVIAQQCYSPIRLFIYRRLDTNLAYSNLRDQSVAEVL